MKKMLLSDEYRNEIRNVLRNTRDADHEAATDALNCIVLKELRTMLLGENSDDEQHHCISRVPEIIAELSEDWSEQIQTLQEELEETRNDLAHAKRVISQLFSSLCTGTRAHQHDDLPIRPRDWRIKAELVNETVQRLLGEEEGRTPT